MLRAARLAAIATWVLLCNAHGADRTFDFTTNAVNQIPFGWRAFLAGEGKPGDWKVILEDVPPTLAPISPNAPNITKQAVVSQTASDITDERFPILIFDGEKYGEFTFNVRFKIVGGAVEQIGGVVFRVQDEKNFYVVRASSLGGNLRFYKFVDGKRQPASGPSLEIPKGIWHTLSIEGSGNRFRVRLNGKDAIPDITDNSFPTGKVGFMTKSDSQVLFVDPRIVYKPIQSLASSMVRTAMEKNPRILNLRIYGRTGDNPDFRVLASSRAADVGQLATKTEQDVMARNVPFLGKEKEEVRITYPLHDRNGETIGAVKFTLRSFKGQTEVNALARVAPIVKEMNQQIGAANDLTE